MSKRCSSKAVGKTSTAITIFILLISFSFISSGAHAVAPGNIRVAMPQYHEFYDVDSYISIPVLLENNSDIEISGFDFLIQYDTSVVELVDVNFETIDECNWFLLGHRPELPGVEKIYAAPGTDPLGCNFSNSFDTLFFLQFYIKPDSANECLTFPLRFYWTQCSDNSLINMFGDSLFMSDSIYDFYEDQLIHKDDTLPTIHGAPDSCYNLAGGYGKYRLVDFANGVIDVACIDDIDETGDVNLNQIPYEIADYVMFTNYYLIGPDVFDVDLQRQLQATDCDKDGIYPTLRDLVFLYRVIIGDFPPLPKDRGVGNKLFPPTALFVQDTIAKEIHLVFPDSLSAIHLIFDGEIVPLDEVPEGAGFSYQNNVTRFIAAPGYSGSDSATYQGLYFRYDGWGILDSCEVADWEMRDIASAVQVIGGEPMCGDINADDVIDIADVIYLLNYIFLAEEPPVSMTAADVNCDGAVNIVDAISIVRYIFTGSPVPCGNCD